MSKQATKTRDKSHKITPAERRAQEQRRRKLTNAGLLVAGVAVIAIIAVVATRGGGGGSSAPADTAVVTGGGPPLAAPIPAGQPIPDFSGPGVNGGTVSWADFKGSPAVVSVWAPWCPHCQKEFPILGEVSRQFPEIRVVTVATAVDEGGPTPQQFLKERNLTFPAALDDADGTIMKALGVQGFPTIYFVNADGTVNEVREGEVPASDLRAAFQAVESTGTG